MKKNLFKKVLSLALVVATVCATAGCGNETKNTNSEIASLSWLLPVSNQPGADAVMEELSKITRDKIGAEVSLQFIDLAAYTERMTMNMASGTAFDICFTGYVNPYINAVDNGGLMAIDELLKEHAPKLLETIPDYAWEIAKVDGNIYAVPNLQGFTPPTSLYFQTALLEKYDFDAKSIQSVEDIEPFLEKIKANEANMIPYRTNYNTQVWTDGVYEEITSGLVVRCDGSSPEVMIIYETPEYKRAISVMHDWYKKGYIRSDLISAGSDSQDYNAGRFAVSSGGWLPGSEATAKASLGRDMTIVPIMNPYLSKSKGLAAMTAIGVNSKNPEKSIKLLELVNTDENVINLLTFGLEGVNYTLDAEGKVNVKPDSGYKINGAWQFGNQFKSKLLVGQEEGIWEETAKLNEKATRSPLLGFVLKTDNIKNEISQITAIQSEYNFAGFLIDNFAQYDEFINKLKTAGLDELKAEVQKQVDEYWKTK